MKAFGLIVGVSIVGDLARLGKALWSVGAAFQTAFGPWGVAIGAAVAAGVLLYENWDTIKEKLSAVWDWIAEKYEKLTNFLSHPIDTLRGLMQSSPSAPAISGMGGSALGASDSRMTGDIRVRIVTDEGTRAEVDDVEADGGVIGVEPTQYGLLMGD